MVHSKPKELGSLIKGFLRVGRQEFSVGGRMLYIDPASRLGLALLQKGNYETALSDYLTQHLPQGGTFVDVGANEGFFSVLAASITGPGGRVVSVEPQPSMWPVILRNASLNGYANMTLLPFAAGDQPGTAELNLMPSTVTGAASLVKKPSFSRRLRKSQRITIQTLDHLLDSQKINHVDLMKIDVEGFELNAVRSMTKHLKTQTIKRLVIELHYPELRALGQDAEEIVDLLNTSGYTVNIEHKYLYAGLNC